ncbi:MAG: GntR family transcriptional regulator [Acidimicrobiales bacterium]|nr:GntR family transcriptional regulator [Acidimicrobiales bacterium]
MTEVDTPRPLRRPPRRSLADDIVRLIMSDHVLSGSVKLGELLASEKQMSEQYDVSRVTVRAAIRTLQDRGIVRVRHGVGAELVFDRSLPTRRPIDSLASIEQLARAAGQVVKVDQLEISEIAADRKTAETFGVTNGESVLRVSRVKTLDDVPVVWVVDVVSPQAISFDVLRSEFESSVLEVLIAHPEVGVARADCELRPVQLSHDVASRLNVDPGELALYIESLTRRVDDDALTCTEQWLLPEYFKFSIHRRHIGDDLPL